MIRVKIIILVCIVVCSTSIGNAQIFSQKTAQLRRLAEQIAALNVYKSYLKTGYKIAKTGLNTITDLKNGDFNIHRAFFSSLKTVNPNLKRYDKVMEILIMKTKIKNSNNPAIKYAEQSGMYREEDLELIKRALESILEDAERNYKDLVDLILDGNLELKDDERKERIDAVYVEMSSIYEFNNSLQRDIMQISKINKHQRKQISNEKILHGID